MTCRKTCEGEFFSPLPVAVTGAGCISAAGNGLEPSLRSLEQGAGSPHPDSGSAGLFTLQHPFPVFACDLPDGILSSLSSSLGFTVPSGNIEQEKEAHLLSRTVRLALVALCQALQQAGLDVETLGGKKVGICLGTSVGASLNFFQYYRASRENTPISLDEINSYLASNPALALARLLKTCGPAQSVTNACSSGADAIGLGCSWIQQGLCDIVIAGGADALDMVTSMGFQSLRLCSPEPCRPFDKERRGLNLGEGAGILVLESEQSRRERKRPGLGAILGYGTSTDAHHLTAPHPEGTGLLRASTAALQQALVKPEDVAFINAHGTATSANDLAEGRFFRSHFAKTPFLSTKACTGHTLGAAGAIEAIFTLGHLSQGIVPASPGFLEPDPEIGHSPLCKPFKLDKNVALSQSLAFGGNNSVLVLGKGEQGLC